MSLAGSLTLYLTLNILLMLGYFGLKALFYKTKRFNFHTKLKWHYFVMLSILLITILHPLVPNKPFFNPSAKVWTAKSLKTFSKDYNVTDHGGYLKISAFNIDKTIDGKKIFNMSLVLFLPLFFIIAGFLLYDLYKLSQIKKQSFPYFKFKNVEILINEKIHVPFSYMCGRSAYVIIPTTLVPNRDFFKIALFHELQHHRQGDTKWVYLIWFLKLICFINPVIHLWSKTISELQEFSCDEILIGQKKISEDSYAHCLIAVAQSCLSKMKAPLCATGLTFLVEDNLLKRRIESMYTKKSKPLSFINQALIFTFFFAFFAGTSYAAKSFVQDKRIQMSEARSLVAKSKSQIPLEMNDLILKQLNRYVGTPEGREFFKASMERMKTYQPMIESKLRVNRLPLELLAIPIVESGYQNLPQDPNHQTWGAGIWMFIESTARVYGLRVDKVVDERLNPDLLTDAAVKYFQSNYGLFSDWKLAILGYNIGERNVERSMKELQTKDAWVIVRSGRENDKDYLARFMAAMIILKNPEIVN